MSVVGFDVGNDASCVAIARKVRERGRRGWMVCAVLPSSQHKGAASSARQQPLAVSITAYSLNQALKGLLEPCARCSSCVCFLCNLPPSALPAVLLGTPMCLSALSCCCCCCRGALMCS